MWRLRNKATLRSFLLFNETPPNSAVEIRIPWLGSKFRSLRKTVNPSDKAMPRQIHDGKMAEEIKKEMAIGYGENYSDEN